MTQILLVTLLGFTSAGAYLVGARHLGLSRRGLRAAAGKVIETLGTTVVFAGINLGLGLAIALGARTLTGTFVSTYLLADPAWLLLSLLQGLTFQWWRECR